MGKDYDDDKQVFSCVCGSYHYLQVNRDEWNGDYRFDIAFVERPKSFRQRLHALRAVFSGETVYHGELYLEDTERLREVLAPSQEEDK